MTLPFEALRGGIDGEHPAHDVRVMDVVAEGAVESTGRQRGLERALRSEARQVPRLVQGGVGRVAGEALGVDEVPQGGGAQPVDAVGGTHGPPFYSARRHPWARALPTSAGVFRAGRR